jgi:zinc protease
MRLAARFENKGIAMPTRRQKQVSPYAILFVLAAVAWSLIDSSPVQSAESAVPTKITSIEGITEYHLDNGLKMLLFPDPSKPTVTVNLTLFVGSRHEGYGEAGMAHLLEHMLFKGTPTHAAIPKLLQARGANFNGTTWYDRTNYYETLPASEENLEFAIRLEADRMVNSNVKGEDLKSEMTVVRNEFEQGENRPAQILSQRMMAVAYDWHNYGKATIGNRADIERVPIESLRRFYKRHYQPDNAMLIVAGSFDEAQALDLAAKYFGAIPRPERVLEETYTEEPPQDGERMVTLRRVGDVSVVGLLYHIPSGGHPDFAPIDVLESILTPAPSGRLYKSLVETRKASRVSGAAFPLHDPGVLTLTAEVGKEIEPTAVRDTMLDGIEKVRDEGVSAEETDRAKQQLLKQIELDAADSTRIAVDLSNWAAQGDWRLYFLYRDRVEKVTPGDVQRIAKAYLRRDNRTEGVFIPVKQSEKIVIPETPDLAAMIGDYKGREGLSEGEVFDVSPLKIEERIVRPKLPGSLRVALLPKKTRGAAVNLRWTVRYGNETNLKGLSAPATLLPELMIRGTEKLSRQEMQDILDKERGELHATSTTPGEATFLIQTKRANLSAMLDLLRQVLREPSLPAEEFEILQRERAAALEKLLNDPTQLAFRAVRRALAPYGEDDPRYVATIAEDINRYKATSRDEVKRVYDEYLGAQGELAIAGDFDVDETVEALTKIAADWKAKHPFAELHRTGEVKLARKIETIRTPEKANATYAAGTVFPMRDDAADYAPLVMADFVLGGGSLSSRLGDRVRQKDGLSYGVQSALNASPVDQRTAFSIFAICNPVNMEKLKAAIDEEVARLLKGGVTKDELELAKKGYLQAQEVARTDDASLAKILADNARAGRTMQYYADLEQRIRSATTKDVDDAFRKYVDPKRMIVIEAGDFTGKAAAASASRAEKKSEE